MGGFQSPGDEVSAQRDLPAPFPAHDSFDGIDELRFFLSGVDRGARVSEGREKMRA